MDRHHVEKSHFALRGSSGLRALAALGMAMSAVGVVPPTVWAQSPPALAPDPDRVRVEALFKRFDADGNGRLSRDEVVTLPVIASKFTVLDTNKDGLLSPDEFTVGFNSPP